MRILFLSLILTSACMSTPAGGLFGSGGTGGFVIRNGTSLNVGTLAMGTNTLEVQEGGTVSGNFTFTEGTLIKDETSQLFTGTYDATNNKLLLSGGSLVSQTGSVTTPIHMSGTGNEIGGLARITQPLTLTDSDTTAAFDLKTALNQNIVLTGGTATLRNNLIFADNAFFVGPGVVSGGTYMITSGDDGITTSAALTFAAVDLTLQNNCVLGAQITTQGETTIHGNAYAIDISGGILHLDAAATLLLADAILNGVTSTTLTFADATSTLKLRNMFLDFDENVTLSEGGLVVTGETTLVLRHKKLLLTGTASLTVDGAVLWYDSLHHDFYADNKAAITLVNGGAVRDIHEHAAVDRLEIAASSTVTTNFVVDGHSPVILGTADAGTVVLDASGHSIAFSLVDTTQLQVPGGVNAELNNVVLKDYSPAVASIGGDGATLTYGEGTRMELGKDAVLSATLPFSGATVLDGKNYCLDLGTGGITVAESSTLRLKNMTLRNVSATNITGLANSSKVVFENVVIELSDDFDFSGGSFEVDKQLLVTGGYAFSYTTSQQSTIRANSSLVLDSGSTFHYNPVGGATDRLVFAAATSYLVLSDSVLKVASTGALLTTGTILIDDTGTFTSLASDLAGALTLGNGSSAAANCTVRITPHSTLHITDGVVKVNDA